MGDPDCHGVELIAEVTVRRFFTHYLEEVFPEQLTAAITAHNRDLTAHAQQIQEAIIAESSQTKLWLIGLIFAGGLGGGVGLVRILGFLTRH